MPHGLDLEDEAESPTEYECLQCGTLLTAGSHPGECDCGGGFQDRRKSLE